jgi:hypothetical protein
VARARAGEISSMAFNPVLLSLVALLVFGRTPAYGQTRLFAETSALFDQDPTHLRPVDAEPALGLGVGLSLANHYSVRFNVEIPQFHERTISSSTRVRDQVLSTTTTESTRTISYSVLAGRSIQASARLRAGVLYGGSLTDRPSRQVRSDDVSTLDGTLIQHKSVDQRFFERTFAVTLGVEITIEITDHLSLVPSLRFHYYPPGFLDTSSPLITRGGVGARWRF